MCRHTDLGVDLVGSSRDLALRYDAPAEQEIFWVQDQGRAIALLDYARTL